MATVDEEIKCEKCGSSDVKIHRREDDSIDYVDCLKCGHRERYFQLTKKGREVIKALS